MKFSQRMNNVGILTSDKPGSRASGLRFETQGYFTWFKVNDPWAGGVARVVKRLLANPKPQVQTPEGQKINIIK